MIITCNKCSTRFNLDDFLVKETGTKVRCTVCKDIFTTYPLSREPEMAAEDSSDLNFGSDSDMGGTFEDDSDFELEENDFSVEESDLEIEGSGLKMEDAEPSSEVSTLETDDDFSFDEDELEIDEDEASPEDELEETDLEFEDDGLEFEAVSDDDFDSLGFESTKETESVSLNDEVSEATLEMEDETDFQDLDFDMSEENLEVESIEDKDEFELEFDVEGDSLDGFPSSPDDETTDPDKEDVSVSVEEKTEDDALPVITPENDFSEYDEVIEQETEPDEDSLEKETVVEDTPEKEKSSFEKSTPLMSATPVSRRRKKKSLIGAPILIILLIFLLVAGAYIASIMTGYNIPYISDIKIPYIEQYLKKPVPETSELKPVPNQKSVNGRFVTNATAGTLFVITGRVENPSEIAYSHIEIQGALITKGKTEAKIKNAFCGNIITEEMLKTGNILDINKLLVIKTGNHNSNVKIKPGASVPFMVVFSGLPEKLQNFTVKVINFEKTKNN